MIQQNLVIRFKKSENAQKQSKWDKKVKKSLGERDVIKYSPQQSMNFTPLQAIKATTDSRHG